MQLYRWRHTKKQLKRQHKNLLDLESIFLTCKNYFVFIDKHYNNYYYSFNFLLFLLGNGVLSIAAGSSVSRYRFPQQFPLTGSSEIDPCNLKAAAWVKHCCRLGFSLRPPLALCFPK